MSEKWGTACGVWGDIIVGLGLFLDRVGKGNILYLGNSDEIVEFLECQPFINKVKKYNFIDMLKNYPIINKYYKSHMKK